MQFLVRKLPTLIGPVNPLHFGHRRIDVQRRITGVLSVLSVAMIGWRILAGVGKYAGSHTPSTLGWNIALGVMGLLFIGCGLTAWFRVRTQQAALFAFYGLFYGMHWGGLISVDNPWLDNTLGLLHLVLSGVLSQAFLLHFALVFSPENPIVAWRTFPYVLYAPAAGAIVLMLLAIVLQRDVELFEQIESWLLTIETVFTNGYFGLAAMTIWVSWFRSDRVSRYETGANLLAIGLLVAITPYVTSVIVVAVLPLAWLYGLGTGPYTLFFSLIPVTFLIAISREGSRAAAPRCHLRQEHPS